MKIKYYAVYSKLRTYPDAMFLSYAWATRFVKDQKRIWVNAKFKIYEIKEKDLEMKFGLF